MRYAFPRVARVRRRAEVQAVYREGQRAQGAHLALYAKRTSHALTRCGVSCSAEVARHATARNRIKRRLRELFRLTKAHLALGWDLLLVARGNHGVDFATLRQEWDDLVKQLGLTQ